MYQEYYKLTDKPFQLSPDARFFFSSKGHNRAMAYLRYGLGQGEGFIVITGGIGTGKTMLVRNLFNELDEDSIIAAQVVSTQVDAEDLVRIVCDSFGLVSEGKSKADLLINLEAFLLEKRQEGKRVLLVVDEAQNLPESTLEELRMLSNYHDEGEALLQSFLLGQVQLKHKLQSAGMEQFRQRIIAGYHLQPLERDETEQYIEFRMSHVGWKDDPLFGRDVFDKIHTATAGVPRRINRLCDRLLLFGALEQLHELEGKHVDTVVKEISSELSVNEDDDFSTAVVPDPAPAETQAVAPGVAVSAAVPAELLNRIHKLELQVESLRKNMARDRKLLKAALFDSDDADDLTI